MLTSTQLDSVDIICECTAALKSTEKVRRI